MGICQSSEAVNWLEQQLIRAVIACKEQKGGPKQEPAGKQVKQSFNGLILRFPKMRPGFTKVQDLYASLLQPGEKVLTLAAFKRSAPQLGLNPNSKCLTSIFEIADVHKHHTIEASELIMVFTVVYLMDPDNHADLIAPEIKTALDIVEKAFCYFDSSSDGYLEKDELMTALKSGSKVYGSKRGQKATKGVGEMLFDLLDFDKSGKVSFKEFLFGIQKLVMAELVDMDEIKEMEDFIVQSRAHSHTQPHHHEDNLPADQDGTQQPAPQPASTGDTPGEAPQVITAVVVPASGDQDGSIGDETAAERAALNGVASAEESAPPVAAA